MLPNPTWAGSVAAAWAELLTADPVLRMCLPTGETPLPVYSSLVGAALSWEKAHVLLLDEFGDLPPREPGGCDATLRRSLLDQLDPQVGAYRTIDTRAADLDVECRAIDQWLDGGLDLAVLGLGRNGHLGMNEPGSAPTGRTRRVDLAESTVQAADRYFGGRARSTWGVTVGLADLLAARTCWVLVSGAAKAETVRACLEDDPDAALPASLLRDHPSCTWWLDEEAAAQLSENSRMP